MVLDALVDVQLLAIGTLGCLVEEDLEEECGGSVFVTESFPTARVAKEPRKGPQNLQVNMLMVDKVSEISTNYKCE